MTTIPRGTDGASPFPPNDLHDHPLPTYKIEPKTHLFRVHSSLRDAVFYRPGAGRKATYRFDSVSQSYGVLYIALVPDAAIIETILRNPQRRMVDYRDVKARAFQC